MEEPLDSRHPARHNIWTPIILGIQERVFLADRRMVDTSRLYIRNAVQDARDKPLPNATDWNPEIANETSEFGELVGTYTPSFIFTFGAFAFEFARRSLSRQQDRAFQYWTTKRLGQEFQGSISTFDPQGVNVLPLLHASIARGKFLVSHQYFTGEEGGNYFQKVSAEIASLLLEHKDNLDIWVA